MVSVRALLLGVRWRGLLFGWLAARTFPELQLTRRRLLGVLCDARYAVCIVGLDGRRFRSFRRWALHARSRSKICGVPANGAAHTFSRRPHTQTHARVRTTGQQAPPPHADPSEISRRVGLPPDASVHLEGPHQRLPQARARTREHLPVAEATLRIADAHARARSIGGRQREADTSHSDPRMRRRVTERANMYNQSTIVAAAWLYSRYSLARCIF